MKIAIFGTGMVGQALSGKLAELGHDVMVGTRDVDQTLANTTPHPYGFPAFSVWVKEHPAIKLGTYAAAAQHGEVLINATNGNGSLHALQLAGEANLNGKVLIDVSNPLDFSQGNPPLLSVANDDSIGEQIQRAYPQVKVVKTLNTVTASLMVDPQQLAGGDHHLFVSGNDAAAKAQVVAFLKDEFSWKEIVDLGDITTARGAEMYLPLWLRLWGALGTGVFNVKVVQ
ncbi:NAD(P)-binding domain-containing protein [Caldilinea sp.]|uniref:NADPH-dependent F420 reductase n=1 Tax=Caldilinea sp. TaxID=2293560 RepID=UPI002C5694E8|nr:NAD(P)-binding domain-containing protein [Anaerolineales bacterium]HQY91755.1 NAD(P)-binding domain-containing protein [Caldilinea sp.]HRA65295.1 NAD(P)-binding domain-containing protein [Caldilinea sp.]